MQRKLFSDKSGLAYWMRRVVEERDKAAVELAPDPVHALRVALRRCLSMADGMMGVDPAPEWKKMRREAKRLLKHLGKLRDLHVLETLAEKISAPEDSPVKSALHAYGIQQAAKCRVEALEGLIRFDRKRWKSWAKFLPPRVARLPLDGPAFEHLALERLDEAFTLHRMAMRRRTAGGLHRLRVALKEYRYTLENFLPARYSARGAELKKVQNCLGELHDLDTLKEVVNRLPDLKDTEVLNSWNARIVAERKQKFDQYRQQMTGKKSLWNSWRAELPTDGKLEESCVAKLGAWAAFVSPNFDHSRRVARMALQMYDGLAAEGLIVNGGTERGRQILHAAALMHDVGRSISRKHHHKASYNVIREQAPPLPWTAEELHMAALIARYHRRALPQSTHRELQSLPSRLKPATLFLAGILRLANVMDRVCGGKLHRLTVKNRANGIVIALPGLRSGAPRSGKLALAKRLLETSCSRTIEILSPTHHLPTRLHVVAARSRVA